MLRNFRGVAKRWTVAELTVSLAASFLVMVAASAQNAGNAAVAPPTPRSNPNGDQIEEIVVTARKREEILQRVPVSVVALTAADLEKRSLDSLAEVGQTTPNLTFSQTANGGEAGGLIYIRGVGQYDDLSTFDPAVGIYIDGVYLARMQNDDLDTMGLERLEVLRGPQGTLFGKNTNGGAINIVTKQPNPAADAFGGSVEVTAGSLNRLDGVANVNIPIVTDKVALELSGARRYEDGYGHYADGEQMANKDRYEGRAALLVKATDDLSITLRADGTTWDEKNASQNLVAVNSSGSLISALNGYQASKGLPLYDSQWVSTNPFIYNGTGPNYYIGKLGGTSATLEWNNPWGTLKSISAYRFQQFTSALDADGTPVGLLNFYANKSQHQISQELQQSGTSFSDRFKWVGGLYFFHESVRDFEESDFPSLNTAFSAPGAPFDANNCQCLYVDNTDYAAYAQGTYSLTDQLHLTIGARYTVDHKGVDRDYTLFEPATGPGAPLQPYVAKSATFGAASPRFGLDYQWTEALMTYVSAAEGFKSGGFNGRAASVIDFTEFEPEKVWTYEVGLRSDWLDKRLRINATAYYSDYKDLQVASSYSELVDGKPVGVEVIENIPKSRITGVELEVIAVPLPGLRLNYSLGTTDAKYIEVTPTSNVTTSMHFPNTPATTFNIGGEYTKALTGSLSLIERVDYTHKTAIDTDLLNGPFLRQPSYGLLDARVTLDTEKGWSFSLFGTNLTNAYYFTGGSNNYDSAAGFALVDMAPPREWGVNIKYRF